MVWCDERCHRSLLKYKFVIMEEKVNLNRIVITTGSEVENQKFPVFIWLSLAVGTVAGVAITFGLFWGLDRLVGF